MGGRMGDSVVKKSSFCTLVISEGENFIYQQR